MPKTETNRDRRIESGKTDYGRIKDPDFAKRIERAMDVHPEIPPPGHGRLKWFVQAFATRYDVTLTPETIRKWLRGISFPRLERRKQLADILGMGEGWLITGDGAPVDAKERRLRNAEVDGAVNVIAGLIQMDGGYPAFPGTTARDTAREGVDLYAVIRGAHYAFNIATAVPVEDGEWKVLVPTKRTELLVLAVIRTGSLGVDVIELDDEAIVTHGRFSAGAVSVPLRREGGVYLVGDLAMKQVKSFSERL